MIRVKSRFGAVKYEIYEDLIKLSPLSRKLLKMENTIQRTVAIGYKTIQGVNDMAGITDQICFSLETKKEILARLKRAEGQIRGIQKMIEEERSCQDLVIQLVAAKEAISQVAVATLSNQLVRCLTMEIAEGNPVDSISEKFIDIFKKLV